MKEIRADKNLVAFCGLYCGACRRYLKGGCPGCHENEKAKWCKVRSCCLEHGFLSCADCETYPDPKQCARFHNFMATIFAFIFNSNRRACIQRIREIGAEAYAQEMTDKQAQSLPRRS